MAKTLVELQAERKAYVKAQADKIANDMLSRGVTQSTLATCDARNWDTVLHHAMCEITTELKKMGIWSYPVKNWGVVDWTFTIKS